MGVVKAEVSADTSLCYCRWSTKSDCLVLVYPFLASALLIWFLLRCKAVLHYADWLVCLLLSAHSLK